eukprot:TRINITY_DN183_c0_g1_i4.p1 TRINITY_DN183_c0_g1~~TRINITY_DN183_c0_g1_i4.p1  ORF type:complete len:105 (+),score=16.00 TRINITY_DN183_c0_g1_i4:617-931(+)
MAKSITAGQPPQLPVIKPNVHQADVKGHIPGYAGTLFDSLQSPSLSLSICSQLHSNLQVSFPVIITTMDTRSTNSQRCTPLKHPHRNPTSTHTSSSLFVPKLGL